MATRTFRGTTDSNWGTATNWLEGAVPLVTDDVIFDATSPNCVLNANRVAKTLTMTNYTNTLSITSALQVSGNITFGAAATLGVDGGYIAFLAAGTLTSNGCVWGGTLHFTGGGTYTLTDNCTIGSYYQAQGIATVTINGFKIFILNSIINNAANGRITDGTTVFEFTGTLDGTFGTSGTLELASTAIRNDIIINKSGGILTFQRYVWLNTGSLSWVAGTVDTTTNSSAVVNVLATAWGDVSGMTFYEVVFAGITSLASHIYCTIFTLRGSGNFSGVGKINGDWSCNTFKTYNVAATWTLPDDITCVNAIFSLGNTNFVLNGAKTIYISGDITTAITNSAQFYLSGTCTIVYNGTGTWIGLSTIATGFNINTAGTLTLNGMCSVATNVTYTAGTIDSTTYPNSGFSVYAVLATTNTTLRLEGNTIENISVSAIYGAIHNITLTSTLNCNNLRIPTWLVKFLGTDGWVCNNLIITGNSHNQYGLPVYTDRYLQLLTGMEYVVNNSLFIATDSLMPFNIKSSTATPALLTFNGTKQQVLNCEVQDIDSSNGNTIWYDSDAGTGTKTNTTNWSPLINSSMTPVTLSYFG